MKKHFLLLMICILSLSTAHAQLFSYDFVSGYQGWTGNFADYPVGSETYYELEFKRVPLPAPLNTGKYALMLSGNNHSDDLFMYLKRKITGLLPNTMYEVSFDVELASMYPTNENGIGGSPGEGVVIKAGATLIEPSRIIDVINHYRMNIDKGGQTTPGADADTIGHVGVTDTTTVYALINRNNISHPFQVMTDADGEVWIIIGTDSGHEGTTTLYYNHININFKADKKDRGTNRGLAGPAFTRMYPNPSNGTVTLESVQAVQRISIMGMDGRVVFDRHMPEAVLDLHLPAGVYSAVITTEEGVSTQKIVIR